MEFTGNPLFDKFGKKSAYRRNDRYRIVVLLIVFMLQLQLYGQNQGSLIEQIEPITPIEPIVPIKPIVPISTMFHNIGWNALGSITYNYGANFIGAVAETYLFIESGWDWQWRTMMYRNNRLASGGIPGLYIGYIVPAITPVMTYVTGRFLKNEKLQMTGLALAQSVLLTLGIQASLKMITGRALPGIVTDLDHRRSARTDDFSGEFEWFSMNAVGGWPSSHTANAFAAAAVITEIYADSLLLKVLLYSYATFIGVGVTLNVHWVSEAIAGALIGYAVGKTVGRDFNRLLHNTNRQNRVTFYASPVSVGVRIAF